MASPHANLRTRRPASVVGVANMLIALKRDIQPADIVGALSHDCANVSRF
jgi:hypothetical protein